MTEPRRATPRCDGRRTRVAVVDRFALVAESIAMNLAHTRTCAPVVVPLRRMCSTAEVCQAVLRSHATIVVLSLTRGGIIDVHTVVEELSSRGFTVLVTGPALTDEDIALYRRAGAVAVHRNAEAADIVEVVTTVLQARTAAAAGASGATTSVPRPRTEPDALGPHPRAERNLGRLAPAEARILCQLMRGNTADDIARIHTVSIATVRTQISRVLAKLEVSSQLSAVALARQAGWDPFPEHEAA